MKIGMLGSGMMAEALGTSWIRAGHEVVVSGRTAPKVAALVERLGDGARAGTYADAVNGADAVLLAVRYEGAVEMLHAAGGRDGRMANKVIIDCSNPVNTKTFTLVTRGRSFAEELQAASRGSRVVKAFNHLHADVWAMPSPRVGDRPLVVPIAGDDHDAKTTVTRLIEALGCEALDLGPLHEARHLESVALVVIKMLLAGSPTDMVLTFGQAAGAPTPVLPRISVASQPRA